MSEPTLPDLLDKLAASVEDYRRAVNRMQDGFRFEVEALWQDQAALRDEVHESVSALSNRIEGAVRHE